LFVLQWIWMLIVLINGEVTWTDLRAESQV
jgi:hypothetical protein